MLCFSPPERNIEVSVLKETILNTLGLQTRPGERPILGDQRQPETAKTSSRRATWEELALQLLSQSILQSEWFQSTLPAAQRVASFEVLKDVRCVRNHCWGLTVFCTSDLMRAHLRTAASVGVLPR